MSRQNTPVGFRISQNKGFQITFENGWTVSVQFGPGNYCQNYPVDVLWELDANGNFPNKSSDTAEIAAWNKEGKWYSFGADTVKGYVSPNEVLKFMNKIAKKKVSAQ